MSHPVHLLYLFPICSLYHKLVAQMSLQAMQAAQHFISCKKEVVGSLAYSHETHTGQSGTCEGSLKREVLWVGTLNLGI